MNYEEKILEALAKQGEMLTALTQKVDSMDGQLDRLETTQTEMQATQAKQGELLTELDERSLRSAVLLEADVTRSLGRLYEGHGAIMEKLDRLASQEQVDAQESDISMMKDAIKMMRLELNELKKAQ